VIGARVCGIDGFAQFSFQSNAQIVRAFRLLLKARKGAVFELIRVAAVRLVLAVFYECRKAASRVDLL